MDHREKVLELISYELAHDDMGVYCASVQQQDGTMQKRTEYGEGWNAYSLEYLKKVSIFGKYIEECPEVMKDYIIKDVVSLALRNGEVSFWINCNDLFYWACADSEELLTTDLHDLSIAYEDSPEHGDILWACRKRGMRPQKPFYKYLEQDRALFDACGPEREE